MKARILKVSIHSVVGSAYMLLEYSGIKTHHFERIQLQLVSKPLTFWCSRKGGHIEGFEALLAFVIESQSTGKQIV